MSSPASSEHEATPVGVTLGLGISLCAICTEKVRRKADGTWEHFGTATPYEPL